MAEDNLPAYKTLSIEARGPIEIVTLDRPEALNALSQGMIADLGAYMSGLKRRTDVRVVLLRGDGRAFCAGIDIVADPTSTDETPFQRSWRAQTALGDVLRSMRSVPQPFIALGHGAACGAGFSLMLACDVRFGAPCLRMNAAYIKIGLGGADIGSSYFLPRIVGASIAAELLLTGRFIDAERALRVGLLSGVVDVHQLLDAGLELAAEMVANAPFGLSLTKQVLNLNIDAPSMESAFALEDRQQIMLTATEDHREAMAAFAEKRAPVYHGR
jgi:enoyl-CoA hydratase/carnithine racemase